MTISIRSPGERNMRICPYCKVPVIYKDEICLHCTESLADRFLPNRRILSLPMILIVVHAALVSLMGIICIACSGGGNLEMAWILFALVDFPIFLVALRIFALPFVAVLNPTAILVLGTIQWG